MYSLLMKVIQDKLKLNLFLKIHVLSMPVINSQVQTAMNMDQNGAKSLIWNIKRSF